MLLFLSRGRHPIFMNKLKFDGHWSNRPHDLANLTKFAKRETERQLNWQVVPIDHDWRDWGDAPILYIASHEPPKIWAQDFDKLYVLDLGGNVRKNPKLSGTTHNVFGIQVGVSINIFVRKRGRG